MARRVNKRFLAVLTLVVMGLLVSGLVLSRFVGRGNHAKLADEARQIIQNASAQVGGEERIRMLMMARDKFAAARRANPGEIAYLMEWGDLAYQLAVLDNSRPWLQEAFNCWTQTLEISPKHESALLRLFDFYRQGSQLGADPQSFVRLGEIARSLADLHPDNPRFKAYVHISEISAWLQGRNTNQERILISVGELEKMAWQPRIDVASSGDQATSEGLQLRAEIARTVGQACLRLAQMRTSEKDLAGEGEFLERGGKCFAEAIKADGNNALLRFRLYEFLVSQPEKKDADLERTIQEKAWAELQKATELAEKEKDALGAEYPRIVGEYATTTVQRLNLLAMRGGGEVSDPQAKLAAARQEAEQRLEQLMKDYPGDLQVRLRLRWLYRQQAGRLGDVVEVLKRPLAPPSGTNPFLYHRFVNEQLERRVKLAHAYLDYHAEARAEERPLLVKDAESEVADLQSVIQADEPVILWLRARLLLLKPDPSSRGEAVILLKKAVDTNDLRKRFDPELVAQLARAYLGIGEPGQAKALLLKLVEFAPRSTDARRQLAELLIREGNLRDAEEQLRQLEVYSAADPETQRLKVMMLLKSGRQTDEAKAIARAMPEQTPDQKLRKAETLIRSGDFEAGEGLLVPLSNEELKTPGVDWPASRLLVQYYLVLSPRKDEAERAAARQKAMELIARAMKSTPLATKWWEMAGAIAEGKATAEQIAGIREGAVAEIEDPIVRGIATYQLKLEERKHAEALDVLVKLEAAHPNDGSVIERLFEHMLMTRDFARAEEYAAKLARLDWDKVQGLYYMTKLRIERGEQEEAVRSAIELTRRQDQFHRNWLLLAQAQMAMRRYQDALVSFDRVLKMQPDSGTAVRGVINCHISLRQFEVARKYIERAKRSGDLLAFELEKNLDETQGNPAAVTAQREEDLKREPENKYRWIALCQNYIRVAEKLAAEKKDDPAIAEYRRKARERLSEAMLKFPDEYEFYLQQAQIALSEGRLSEGAAVIRQLRSRERFKDSPGPSIMLAEYYMRAAPPDLEKAEAAYKEAVELSKNALAYRWELLNFYRRTRQTEKAIDVMSGIVAQTQDADHRKTLIELQAMAGRLDEAEKALQQAIDQSPRDARLLALMGYVKLRMGQYTQCEQVLRRALSVDPKHAPAHYYLGMLQKSRSRLVESRSSLETARDLRPTDPEIYAGLAEVLFQLRMPAEAAREMQKALDLAPSRRDLREKLLRFHLADKRWTAAEDLLAKTRAIPELADEPYWLQVESQMWVQRDNLDKALASIEAARKLAPGDPEVLYQHLDVLRQRKEHEKILAVTEPFVRSTASVRPWWLHTMRADAFKATGRPDQAVSEFERAMSQADAAGDGYAAQEIGRGMVANLGLEQAVQMLAARRDPRWRLVTIRQYLGTEKWDEAIKSAQELAGPEYASLTPQQQIAALGLVAVVYQTAAAANPQYWDQAEKSYIRVLEELDKRKAPPVSKLETLNNLAVLWAERTDKPNPREAQKYSAQAYEIMTGAGAFSPGVADTHGWLLVLCDKVSEGIEILHAARSAAEYPFPEVYYHLGEAYMRTGNPQAAREHLERARAVVADYRKRDQFVDPQLMPRIAAALQKVEQAEKSASGTP